MAAGDLQDRSEEFGDLFPRKTCTRILDDSLDHFALARGITQGKTRLAFDGRDRLGVARPILKQVAQTTVDVVDRTTMTLELLVRVTLSPGSCHW